MKQTLAFDTTRPYDRYLLRLVAHADSILAFQAEWRNIIHRVAKGKDEKAFMKSAEAYLYQQFHELWKKHFLNFVFQDD